MKVSPIWEMPFFMPVLHFSPVKAGAGLLYLERQIVFI